MAPKRRGAKKKYRPVINDVFRHIAWNQEILTRKKPKGCKYKECLRNFAKAGAQFNEKTPGQNLILTIYSTFCQLL